MSYQFVYLTPAFYSDFSACPEIEQKPDRPHLRLLLQINGIIFAVPFRSNIPHPHALLTDPVNHCGLDFSKAVAIDDEARYIDHTRTPRIRQNEFNALKGKERVVEAKMLKYLRNYAKALERPDIPRNAMLLQCSTLQYFPHVIPKIIK